MTRSKPRKARVRRERTVHTYAELWHASRCVLEVGLNKEGRSTWQFLSSLVLTAFAFEAFLNHAGQKLTDFWPDLERLPPLSKLNILCELTGVTFHGGKGARPLSTIVELFNFRNDIAHGKTFKFKQDTVIDVDHLDKFLSEPPQTHREKLIANSTFASRAHEDVQFVAEKIHEKCPEPRGLLFDLGFSIGGADVL